MIKAIIFLKVTPACNASSVVVRSCFETNFVIFLCQILWSRLSCGPKYCQLQTEQVCPEIGLRVLKLTVGDFLLWPAWIHCTYLFQNQRKISTGEDIYIFLKFIRCYIIRYLPLYFNLCVEICIFCLNQVCFGLDSSKQIVVYNRLFNVCIVENASL